MMNNKMINNLKNIKTNQAHIIDSGLAKQYWNPKI